MREPSGTPRLVALTTTVDPQAGSHARPAVLLYANYINALERSGVAAVLITPAHSPATIDALVAACCGLVLTGGEDVDPSYYGEQPSPALGTVQRARDEMEFRALDGALQRGMPIFGICRGVQVMNVFFGGTLYQDIDTQLDGGLRHRQAAGWGAGAHEIDVESDSLLCSIVRKQRLCINSFHHQAVKEVGRDLRVTARAADGVVEAIEHTTHPWLLGVQWHPERNHASTPDTDPDLRLFAAFGDAVAKYAGTVAAAP